MNIYIADVEVFRYNWVFVCRRIDSDHYTVITNNNFQLVEWFANHSDDIFGFYNGKHYDRWILQSILHGADVETVKAHNDYIVVQHGNGWEFPFVQFKRKLFRSFDLKDDLPKGLSLKAIEGNMYLPIVESSIPFDIDRPLTPEELDEVIHYCKNDVDATLALYNRRREYIGSKLTVAKLKGIDPAVALAQTNAKLAALYLDAKPIPRSDGRDYRIPENLDREMIPKDVLDFFGQITDDSIPDAELYETSLTTQIGGCECVFAWGGVHGAIPNLIAESDPEGSPNRRIIVNYDVASLYPNSMLNFGYVSRNCESPTAYRDLVDTRIKAKRAGDKAVANALKLVINTTYGAMLNEYNPLYDERCGRSVCISNQLSMCELVCRLEKHVPSFEIINFNTDGVMFRILESESDLVTPILDEWQKRVGFELERDDVRRIVQKDVNNYLAEEGGGKIKACGDYVKRWRGDDVTDENDVKARLINNDLTIVQIALVERLLHDVPVEETINACSNPFYFQQIAKFGASYTSAFHEVDGERVPVQKVNRVYAVADPRFGTVKKVKPSGKVEKIASLPDHCIIDNENRVSLDQIDRQFYIDLANERVDQYLKGKKKSKRKVVSPMATQKKTDVQPVAEVSEVQPDRSANVFQKLLAARLEFLDSGVKKSGVNRFAEFEYFELSDIVPVATRIFSRHGLMLCVTYEPEVAVGALVNVDKPEEVILFHSPNRELDYSKIKGMNALQGLGSEQTYHRRYLYMAVLDIVEHDGFDATLGKPAEKASQSSQTGAGAAIAAAAEPKSPKKPASQDEREEVRKELTAVESRAEVSQTNAIVRALKKLRDKDPKYEPFIGECQSKLPTKKNPDRVITKQEADDMLKAIGEKMEE